MTFLLITVAALVTLLILPGWSFFFDVTPKVVVAAAAAAAVLVLPRIAPSPLPPRLKWFGILAAGQAGVLLIATLFSTHLGLSVLGSTWRKDGLFSELAVLILAVAAAEHFAADAKHLRMFLRITVLAAIPAAVYGIAQYFGIDPWIPAYGYHVGEGRLMIVRPPSTLGHAVYFATYLLFPAFGGADLAFSETSRGWKSAALLASALASFAIVLSGTRAALAGLIVGALFIAVRQPLRGKWIGGALAALVLLAGFYISPGGAALQARVHWSQDDPVGGARLLLWRDTLRMAAQRLLGYGPETFTAEFPRHESIELARAYPNFYHESPHNIFLDALISNGLPGLLMLAAIAAFGLTIAEGFIGGAFVALLASQQFSAFTLPTELYFFLCLAILAGRLEAPRVVAIPVRPWQWVLAAPFACFAMVLGLGDFLLASGRRALNEEKPERAAHYIADARIWHASADIYFSRRFLVAKAGQSAMDCALRAPGTADNLENALVNLAEFQAAQDDAQGVEKSLREAIATAPNGFKSHWLLAQVLAHEGRTAEAQFETKAAADREGEKFREGAGSSHD